VQQVRTLVNDSPDLVRDATDWVNRRFNANITTDKIVEQLRKYQGDLASTAGDLGGRVVSVTGSVLGVVFNRLIVSWFAMNWTATEWYIPSWMEVITSLTIVTTGVVAFRWIVNRMPVLSELPEYRGTSH
jgi:hypothetical protein